MSTLLSFLYHPLFSLCQMLYPRKLEVGIEWAVHTRSKGWIQTADNTVGVSSVPCCGFPSQTSDTVTSTLAEIEDIAGVATSHKKPFKNTFQGLINNSSLCGESRRSPCGDGTNCTHGEHLTAFTFNQGFPGSSVFLCSGQILLFLLCLCCFVL